jgi:hypothetical protein
MDVGFDIDAGFDIDVGFDIDSGSDVDVGEEKGFRVMVHSPLCAYNVTALKNEI